MTQVSQEALEILNSKNASNVSCILVRKLLLHLTKPPLTLLSMLEATWQIAGDVFVLHALLEIPQGVFCTLHHEVLCDNLGLVAKTLIAIATQEISETKARTNKRFLMQHHNL